MAFFGIRKNEMTKGVFWSSVDKISVQGLNIVLSFVVARQLNPSDYGLVAMFAIFSSVAQSFVDSGFSNALVQKRSSSQTDYSTVFYFNVLVGAFLTAVLMLSSGLIADFYRQPLLRQLVVWSSLNVFIVSFMTVQKARLSILLDFKTQAAVSILSVVAGGAVAVWMAYSGFGVWTLVVQTLVCNSFAAVALWILAGWRPSPVFSWKSFRELFGFGSKILAGGLINTVYTNIHSFIIGKVFTSSDLGLYNRSYTMTQLPSSTVSSMLDRVFYPVECRLQDDNRALQLKFYQFLKVTTFFIFPMMFGLAALADPLIRVLLTDKWAGAVPYVQIMCFAYMWDPVMRFTAGLLNVKHRSDLYLKAEFIKKLLAVVLLLVTVPLGIKAICYGLLVYSITDIVIVTFYTARLLPQVTFFKILKSLVPNLVYSSVMALAVRFFISFSSSVWVQFVGGLAVGVAVYLVLALVFPSPVKYLRRCFK